jgi:site-specific DNA recombinase
MNSAFAHAGVRAASGAQASSVRCCIKAYIGQARWGSSYAVVPIQPLKHDRYRKTKKSSRRMRPEEEWHLVPVPDIINKELFKRAQTQLATHTALSQRNKKNEYLLAGKIRCVSGRTRAGEGPLRGKHLYYRCSDRVSSFPQETRALPASDIPGTRRN